MPRSNTSTEGAHAENDESARNRSRTGPRRGPRSMGRHPFQAFAEEYLQRREAYLAKTSLEEQRRKAKFLNRELANLKQAGRISTTSPQKMTEADIRAIIMWMDERGNKNDYKAKNLGFLKAICEYSGNGVFTKMKAGGIELPKMTPKDLFSLSTEDLDTILKAAEKLEGWNGEVARFLVWMYPFTGLRASELRQAHLEDIDTKKWTIRVRHPKGEKRYARQRTAPILPPARPAVLRYLEARKMRVKEKSIETEALIPALHGGFYSSNGFRRMKADLEKKVNLNLESPISFKLKDFRATFCQQSIDRGAQAPAVSVAMGHASTKTTETYYGRMRSEKALDNINTAWSDASEGAMYQHRVIDKKYDPSGYA
jgi:integrase